MCQTTIRFFKCHQNNPMGSLQQWSVANSMFFCHCHPFPIHMQSWGIQYSTGIARLYTQFSVTPIHSFGLCSHLIQSRRAQRCFTEKLRDTLWKLPSRMAGWNMIQLLMANDLGHPAKKLNVQLVCRRIKQLNKFSGISFFFKRTKTIRIPDDTIVYSCIL